MICNGMLNWDPIGLDTSNRKRTHKALSLHGWKVAASHATAGSNVEIDEIREFASLPVRPLFTLTVIVLVFPSMQSCAYQ